MKFPRLRYRLRTFLFLALLVGVVLGSLGIVKHQARKQQRAVATITELGGEARYDFHRTDTRTNFLDNRQPSLPAWLVSFLGRDFFCRVVEVRLSHNPNLSNDDTKVFRDLPHIKTLFLCNDRIDGESLKNLAGLKHLEDLSLGIKLDDDDLPKLGQMKSLQEIYLMGPCPKDYVVRLKGPELVFDVPQIYDSGLSGTAIQQLAKSLPGCRITY